MSKPAALREDGNARLRLPRLGRAPVCSAIGGALLLALGGGCVSPLPDRAARMQHAYVYYLDGAGGGQVLSNWGGGVRAGLLDAGYDGAGEMFAWETGFGMLADQVASVEYKRQKAGDLAQRIVEFVQQHPDAPVHLIGLSAGTALATFALEALPDGVRVENVILLSGSLSADYDVTRALRRVRNKMYVFTSQRDGVLLYLEPMFGSADRQKSQTGVIGVCGLSIPAGAAADTRRQYAKIVNVPWRPEFAESGEYGQHTDTVKAPFVQKYVAPLVMQGRTTGAASAAADTVENPDYARWAHFGVGSSTTFEGYQVLDGVRQRIRLTATLVAKQADSLLVERRFVALGEQRTEPRVRQFFVRARVKPTEHPLTHPQSVVRELPGGQMRMGLQVLACTVRSIRAPADFPEWGRDLSARVWGNDAIPGGLVRYEMTAAVEGVATESSGRITEYRAVPP